MKVNNKEYSKMTQKATPNSEIFKNCIKAFFMGGTICTIGQLLTTFYIYIGMNIETARTTTSITLIFLGATLTAFGVYDKLAKLGAAGTLLPITGFANAITASAIEYKVEGYIIGIGSKMFIIAGPVLVYGVLASTIWGVIFHIINSF